MRRIYEFFSDSGHGWLKVPLNELYAFGIADKISGYSYMKGNFAYLEEDDDASLFLERYKSRFGMTPKFKERIAFQGDSRIRNYAPFKFIEGYVKPIREKRILTPESTWVVKGLPDEYSDEGDTLYRGSYRGAKLYRTKHSDELFEKYKRIQIKQE